MCTEIEMKDYPDVIGSCGELVAALGLASLDDLIQYPTSRPLEQDECLCGVNVPATLKASGYRCRDMGWAYRAWKPKPRALPEPPRPE